MAPPEWIRSAGVVAPSPPTPPEWIARSPLLVDAYSLAEDAHGTQRRASDRHYFLEHVLEVAELLHEAGFDDEIVAVGLLHDAVERGTLDQERLRDEMGASIASLVLALSEDPEIASFDRRKASLRRQVEGAGRAAMTVYAADKLSDIRGLCRGMETRRGGLEERLGTTVAGMSAHYRESVEMIEAVRPASPFVPLLRAEMARLDLDVLAGPGSVAVGGTADE